METNNDGAAAQPKRKVRSPEERRAYLQQQLSAFDAREDARLRASVLAIIADIERLKLRASKAMKGRLHTACEQAAEVLSHHTKFPSV